MICPNCIQEIKRGADHCENCGQPLFNNPLQKVVESNSPKEILLIYTGRLFFTLLAIWLVRIVVNSLSFINELIIPEININALIIINIIITVIVFCMILSFSIQIKPLWAMCYPKYQQVGLLFQTILNLILINMLYKGLKPILMTFEGSSEIMLIIQITLLLIVIGLVTRTMMILYREIPVWLGTLREDFEKNV
ncbi:MAG: zinc ribbon domain-containing protein [Bacteroidales bacterium]|nr:zinc ribbon domain-containing protein [Bacteroidales bacterium]